MYNKHRIIIRSQTDSNLIDHWYMFLSINNEFNAYQPYQMIPCFFFNTEQIK